MVCLCSNCHYLIHHGKPNKVNFSRAIKAGQKRAVENGSHLGCLPLSVQRINPNIIGDIIRYDKGIGNIKMPEISKKYGLSRNTLYYYIRILNNETCKGRKQPTKYDSLVTKDDYCNLNDGTLLDVMQIGYEWINDRDEWINCVKEGNKLHILSNYNSYYDIDECDTSGYEYIIKYNNST